MANNEWFEIHRAMDKIKDEMAKKIEISAPICHFRKMIFEESDSVDGYYTNWWECSVCGHVKRIR
jgi:hypothetical protein